jgi:hypothetical protein
MSSDKPTDNSEFTLELSLEDGEEKNTPAKEEPKKEVASPPQPLPSSGLSLDLDDEQEVTKVEEAASVEKKTVETTKASGLSLDSDDDSVETTTEIVAPIEVKSNEDDSSSAEENSSFDLSLNEEAETEEAKLEQETSDSVVEEEQQIEDDKTEDTDPEESLPDAPSAFATKPKDDDYSDEPSEKNDEDYDTETANKPTRSNDPYSNEIAVVPTKRKFSFEDMFSFLRPTVESKTESKPAISRPKIIALVGAILLLVLMIALQPGSESGTIVMDMDSPDTLKYLISKQEAITAPKKPPTKIEEIVIRTWNHEGTIDRVSSSIAIKTENNKVTSFTFNLETKEPPKRTPEEIVNNIKRAPWLAKFSSNEIEFLPIRKTESNLKENEDTNILRLEGTGDGRAFIKDDSGSSRIIVSVIVKINIDKTNDKLWGDWKIIHSMAPDKTPDGNYAKRIAPEDFELYYFGKFTGTPVKTAEDIKVKTESDQKKLKEVIKNDAKESPEKKN